MLYCSCLCSVLCCKVQVKTTSQRGLGGCGGKFGRNTGSLTSPSAPVHRPEQPQGWSFRYRAEGLKAPSWLAGLSSGHELHAWWRPSKRKCSVEVQGKGNPCLCFVCARAPIRGWKTCHSGTAASSPQSVQAVTSSALGSWAWLSLVSPSRAIPRRVAHSLVPGQIHRRLSF